MSRFSVDQRSYNLAEHFLEGHKDVTLEQKKELAQQIQDICEDFLNDLEREEECPRCHQHIPHVHT